MDISTKHPPAFASAKPKDILLNIEIRVISQTGGALALKANVKFPSGME